MLRLVFKGQAVTILRFSHRSTSITLHKANSSYPSKYNFTQIVIFTKCIKGRKAKLLAPHCTTFHSLSIDYH